MNRGKMSRFNHHIHQWQDAAKDTAGQIESAVREQASSLAEQTRDGLAKGQKAMGAWEKGVEDSVRANPMLYFGAALAAAALGGVLIGALLKKRKR
ncbi:MAG: hypothetical protein ACFUZC_18530 [Chthoniobacteraceae bacterium]